MKYTPARGTALFFGCFSLVNGTATLWNRAFDATELWLDLRMLPAWVHFPFTMALGLALVTWAWRPACGRGRGHGTDALLLAAIGVAVCNAAWFVQGAAAGAFVPAVPIPFSLIVAGALSLVFLARADSKRHGYRFTGSASLAVAAWLLALPMLQMILFGKTNYTRRADAAVVFGAAVYRSGRPSHALYDRTRTGILLYRSGVVGRLVFSGGPGPGPVHETEAMRRLAVAEGVPAEHILTDAQGHSTRESVRNTVALFDKQKIRSVLAVSHFYHLPRIKLAYARAGQEVYTVPAIEVYPLHNLPWYMLREVVALWVYYLRP